MEVNKNFEFSFRKGIKFEFNDKDNNIIFIFSTFSGKETIIVNGRVILESRSFKRYIEHVFCVDDKNYTITLTSKNLWSSELMCSLKRGHKVITKYEARQIKSKPKFWLRRIIAFLGGYALMHLYMTKIISLSFTITLAVGLMLLVAWVTKNKWECHAVD